MDGGDLADSRFWKRWHSLSTWLSGKSIYIYNIYVYAIFGGLFSSSSSLCCPSTNHNISLSIFFSLYDLRFWSFDSLSSVVLETSILVNNSSRYVFDMLNRVFFFFHFVVLLRLFYCSWKCEIELSVMKRGWEKEKKSRKFFKFVRKD